MKQLVIKAETKIAYLHTIVYTLKFVCLGQTSTFPGESSQYFANITGDW